MKISNSHLLRAVGLALLTVLAGTGALDRLTNGSILAAASAGESGGRVPVLVELFTSEGCSSCPPADALLARLDATQFVPGADAIVLSEHVTYWNDLGWRDPFSSDVMTERQNHYAQQFGLSSVYTPQAVVDGSTEVLGSDAAALGRAIAHAELKPRPQLAIEGVTRQADTIHFTVRSSETTHGMLMAALAEDGTQSSVARGENAGRTLRHVAVVRSIKQLGRDAADGRPLMLNGSGLQSTPAAKQRLVVFLVDPQTGHVEGVVEQALVQ
jgi:hypothetical protein